MSLAGVHQMHQPLTQLRSNSLNAIESLSHSLDDVNLAEMDTDWSPVSPPQQDYGFIQQQNYAPHHHYHYQYADHVMTIEELRLQMSSCFTCGVSWSDSHVSLDCSECGGYALDRPCPTCDGKCGAVWKRDLSLSHSCNKARWAGECCYQTVNDNATSTKIDANTDKHTKRQLDQISSSISSSNSSS